VSLGKLLLRTSTLQKTDMDKIVTEFELCRSALMECMEIKLSHWKQLPHRLCAIGCTSHCGTSEAPAREAVQDCIVQYGMLSVEQRASMWPLVFQICDPASPIRSDVYAFMNGAPLADLPAVKRIAAETLCIPVCERSVEARHRHNKLNTSRAPNAGGAFVNVQLKIPGLSRRMADDPQLLLRLATTIGTVRKSAKKLASLFNLHGHPTLVEEIGKKGKFSRELLSSVFYRLDSKTQHQRQDVLHRAFPPAPKGGTLGYKHSVNQGLR